MYTSTYVRSIISFPDYGL